MPTPERPFANYRPPQPWDFFSESGKIAILEFKAERLVERVRDGLLEDNGVDDFLSGRQVYR